jgi:regulator of replication initiation timing
MLCVFSAIIIYLTGLFPLPHRPPSHPHPQDMQKKIDQLKVENKQLKVENKQLKVENEQLKEKNEQQRRAIEIQNKQVKHFAASFLNNTINTECETKDTHVHKKEER